MSRTRAGLLILALLLAGFVVWLIFDSRNNMMKAAVASSNGSNYSLELRPDLEPAYFNDNASLQYHSETEDYSVMVIDDSKEKIASFGLDYDLDTYMKIATRTLDSAGMYVNATIAVNDVKALQATIKGKRDGVPTTFVLTCIETPHFYYQLVCWTPTDKFGVNREKMDAIIASFTEENPQPAGE
ncbi:MAG TPA: hypothetical protein VK826_10615 [Bacteroidia bacterium]|nr:hypothetical protein [Bacteroidia bacterium]